MTLDATKAKSIFMSKTFWGALIAMLMVIFPTTFKKLGVTSDSVSMWADKIVGALGSLLAIYGRLVATQTATLTAPLTGK